MNYLRELGWECGKYSTGINNCITDVPGVSIGHSTIIKGEGRLIPGNGPIRTGVTVVKPHEGNLFQQKVFGSVFISNGFGKSTGIPQILETGLIESPIAITNTLNVGLVYDALVSYSIEQNPEIGIKTGSVNPIVTECFDGFLNDIQGRHVKEHHVLDALKNAKPNIKIHEGCVGAGTGMRVFGLKSGVGTSSRQLVIKSGQYEGTYHIGALVVPNYGFFEDFQFYGIRMSHKLDKKKYLKSLVQKNRTTNINDGSVILIVATDLPLNNHQLKRLAYRASLGITLTGNIVSHGSGDFIFSFSTANKIQHYSSEIIGTGVFLHENNPMLIDIFRMTIDLVLEAIYNGILSAKTMIGRDNHILVALDQDDLPKPP